MFWDTKNLTTIHTASQELKQSPVAQVFGAAVRKWGRPSVEIEQAIIDTLAHWRIPAERRAGAPGVYVGEAKIAALGLRVRHGCSFHGLAMNVNMDLSPFYGINPCGYTGLQVTQLVELAGETALSEVAAELVSQLSGQLGLQPAWLADRPPALNTESVSA